MKDAQYSGTPMMYQKNLISPPPPRLKTRKIGNGRRYASTELSASDFKTVQRLMAKMGVPKATILRALLRLGLERAKEMGTDEKSLMKMVRLGKL